MIQWIGMHSRPPRDPSHRSQSTPAFRGSRTLSLICSDIAASLALHSATAGCCSFLCLPRLSNLFCTCFTWRFLHTSRCSTPTAARRLASCLLRAACAYMTLLLYRGCTACYTLGPKAVAVTGTTTCWLCISVPCCTARQSWAEGRQDCSSPSPPASLMIPPPLTT